MVAITSKFKPLSLIQIILNSLKLTKQNWPKLLNIILFAISLIIVCLIIIVFSWGLLVNFNLTQLTSNLKFRLLWQIINWCLFYLIAVLAQLLLLNRLFYPQLKLLDNLKSTKTSFIQFLCLTLILSIFIFLASLPIYVGFFLFAIDNNILGFIAFILGFIMLFFTSCYLIFSPFILVERNLSFLEAIKKSFILTEGYFANILLKLIILCFFIILLNLLSLAALVIPKIGTLLSILIVIFMIIFTFNYLFSFYQNFKSLKNI